MTLKELKPGEKAEILSVGGTGALRQHFLDMGVLPGARVEMIKLAPMGDPMELRIHSYELSLRLADAAKIEVRPLTSEEVEIGEGWQHEEKENGVHMDHPGIGEYSPLHEKKHRKPLPESVTITMALAGNQNSGKTTLFNQLTGSNQHVGNFPGVTVDRKDGVIKGHPETLITDLPGIYSMSPYSSEELVTRRFILEEKPKAIINIVDATNIERNLYLTMQLLELDIPMVVALNMMDEVRENGGSIRINELEAALGVPVVPISAAKGEGISELVEHALHVARYREKPLRQDFCDSTENGGAVHRCLHGIMHLIQDHAEENGIPVRFAAGKLVEGDELMADALKLNSNEREIIAKIIKELELERGLDAAAAIADMRFSFIRNICRKTVIKPRETKERIRSMNIDRILTGKYTAIPCFVVIMGFIFWMTFRVLGVPLQDAVERGVMALAGEVDTALMHSGVNPVLRSLVADGIFGGVGTVISFMPLIMILFLFLSLLEDSGYMARIAFVMDRPLRKIGLSGRSIVPMLVGFGCTVPGVMASRTLPSERDRRLTIIMTPYMSCSAKIPIYSFIAAAFFPGREALVMLLMYFTGIIVGIAVAAITQKTGFKGEAVPFVMELPNYRMPGIKNVGRLLWDKSKDFLQRAFTVILLCTIVIWFLRTFNTSLHAVDNSEDSMMAALAGLLVPIFRPLGFGDWRIVTALISGFMAKESVVSIITVLFGSLAAFKGTITPLGAVSLLVFSLLYTPCVAAVESIRRELGAKWAIGILVEQCTVAWLVAGLVTLVGRMLGFA